MANKIVEITYTLVDKVSAPAEKIYESLKKIGDVSGAAATASDKTAASHKKLEGASLELKDAMTRLETAAGLQSKAFDGVNTPATKMYEALKKAGFVSAELNDEIRKEAERLNEASRATQESVKNTDTLTESKKKNLKLTLESTVALGALVYKLRDLGKGILDNAKDYEVQKTALTAMTGSMVSANKILNDAAKLAAKTPFERKDLVEYVKQLYAAGIAQKELMSTMILLGDVAAGIGQDKLPAIVYVYRQILAAGRAVGNDFRQLEDAAVPIFEYLSKLPAFAGKSALEIRKMGSEGLISAGDITAAFKLMTSEGEKFHGMMNEQAKTTTGKLSNLADALGILAVELGTPLLTPLNFLISTFTTLVSWVGNLPTSMKLAIATFFAATTATLGLSLAVGILTTAVGGLGSALYIVGASAGIGLLAAGIGASVYVIQKHFDTLKIGVQFLKIVFFQMVLKVVDEFAKIPRVIGDAVKAAIVSINWFIGQVNKIPGVHIDFKIALPENKSNFLDTWSAGLNKEIADTENQIAYLKNLRKKATEDKQMEEAKAEALAAKKREQELQESLARAKAQEDERLRLLAEAQAKENAKLDKAAAEKAQLEIDQRTLAFERKKALDSQLFIDDDAKKKKQIENEIAFNQSLLAIEGLSEQQKQDIKNRGYQLETERLVAEKDAKDKQIKTVTELTQQVGRNEISVADAVKKGVFQAKKDEIIATIELEATKMTQIGWAMLTASGFTNPMGYAHLAGGAALFAGGKAAVNAIKLADGGVVMPKPGGVPAIIGEAGRPEAVIPLDDPRSMEILGRNNSSDRVIILTDDGKELAKGIYKKQTELLRTGELSPRL